ncbi:MAG: hypothetical protein E6G97_18255 [Alphaproteobacteria bacterium]|nr:MAG: hypothetical protein E6G97_18255 [Alphaproteobacteria bacterium]
MLGEQILFLCRRSAEIAAEKIKKTATACCRDVDFDAADMADAAATAALAVVESYRLNQPLDGTGRYEAALHCLRARLRERRGLRSPSRLAAIAS